MSMTECAQALRDGVIVNHSSFLHVREELLRFVQYGRHDECVLLIGPSGMGKSTMIKHFHQYLVNRQAAGWCSDRGKPIYIEAGGPKRKEFPWWMFLVELLELLGETNIRKKVDLDVVEERRRSHANPPLFSKLRIEELERLLFERVAALRPLAILIDEAQNLVCCQSEDTALSNIIKVKGWANKMDTILLLGGTHEARGLLDVNEQTARRIVPIYFPRYKRDQILGFAEFYKGLIAATGIEVSTDLQKDFNDIYNDTLGCVGLLCSQLLRATSFCADKQLPAVTKKIFHEMRSPYNSLVKAERAIKEFEAFYQQSKRPFSPDLILLDEDSAFDADVADSKKRLLGNATPGQRKPARDPVK